MNSIHLSFHSLPEIGFAHHFYAESYHQTYGIHDNSFELVYVKSGKLAVLFEEKTYTVSAGGFFILCRHLPIQLYTLDDLPHSHCSIQLICDYTCSPVEDRTGQFWDKPGLTLPFILPPCAFAETISKKMHHIISQLHANPQANAQSCAFAAMGILAQLHQHHRSTLYEILPSSALISARVKEYIDRDIRGDLTLAQLASVINRSPNYLNSLFSQAYGTSIRQYINSKKVNLITELMIHKNADFPTACENVGITDVQYGYRLFRKHLGMTPKQYLATAMHATARNQH